MIWPFCGCGYTQCSGAPKWHAVGSKSHSTHNSPVYAQMYGYAWKIKRPVRRLRSIVGDTSHPHPQDSPSIPKVSSSHTRPRNPRCIALARAVHAAAPRPWRFHARCQARNAARKRPASSARSTGRRPPLGLSWRTGQRELRELWNQPWGEIRK